jgi:hypothetical protein
MAALKNPRHEAFAQAIFAGLTGKTRAERAQSTAYLQAYPSCSPGPPAWVSASQLLRRTKVWERVGELQAEQYKRLQPKIDISRERIGRNLDEASRIAKQQNNAAAIVSAELGIAKVFGLASEQPHEPTNFKQCRSMQDIGKRLLQSVGLSSPDDASVAEAVALNDQFVAGLEKIVQRAQALVIEQND